MLSIREKMPRWLWWAVLMTALTLGVYLTVQLARPRATSPSEDDSPVQTATTEAASLVPGEVADGSLGAKAPDIWRFDAQAGQSVTLEIWVDPRDGSGPEARFGLELTGPDDITLIHKAGSASLPPYEKLKLPVSGTYYVRIIPLSGSLGQYSVRLTIADDPPPTPSPNAGASTPTPQPERRTYTVEEGDTLWDIALAFDVTAPAIVAINENLDAPDDILHPGMVIAIPAPPPTPTPLPEGYYVVQRDDTLWKLARESEYTVEDWIIANAKTLKAPYELSEDQVLRIPERSSQGEPLNCARAPGWKERREVITHVVRQEGMNLACLSYKFSISISTIRWANREQLGDNPDLIKVGQTLTILPVDGMLHTVTEGETLEGIAERYQVEVTDIVSWQPNHLKPDSELTTGQDIVIPNGSPPLHGWNPAASAAEPGGTPQPTPELPEDSTPGAGAKDSAPPGGVAYVDPFYALSKYDTGYCSDSPAGRGWSGDLSWPTESHNVDPDRSFSEWHPAIDIPASLNSPVYAAETGVVIWAGWSSWGGGNLAILDHGGGRWTLYAHLGDVSVECGQTARRGGVIGTVGQTGASSFPHLHFEFRRDGYNYNPLNWLP